MKERQTGRLKVDLRNRQKHLLLHRAIPLRSGFSFLRSMELNMQLFSAIEERDLHSRCVQYRMGREWEWGTMGMGKTLRRILFDLALREAADRNAVKELDSINQRLNNTARLIPRIFALSFPPSWRVQLQNLTSCDFRKNDIPRLLTRPSNTLS